MKFKGPSLHFMEKTALFVGQQSRTPLNALNGQPVFNQNLGDQFDLFLHPCLWIRSVGEGIGMKRHSPPHFGFANADGPDADPPKIIKVMANQAIWKYTVIAQQIGVVLRYIPG